MSSEPKKPKARPRRKAAPKAKPPAEQPAEPSVEPPAASVALMDDPAAPDAGTAAESRPSLEGRAEAVAMALAAFAGDEEPEADVVEPVEERIRSVQELLARGEGEVELLLFRVGSEAFAFDLAAAEEAVELEAVHPVPDMPDAMLGVFDLRGRLVPVYSPAGALRAGPGAAEGVLLLMRADGRRLGIVVDDVQDVVVLGHAMLRPPPSGEGDGVVLGVAFFGDDLVTILDAHALVATCALPATAEVA